MSSSDTGTSGQKRQRVSRACDLCRRKKIKCDGGTPICGNCQAFNLECSYKDMTKKRGPPKGYIEAVESRLHKLEAFLRDMAKNDTSDKCKEILNELNSPLETASGQIINNRPVRRAKDSEPGNSSKQQQQQQQLSSISPKESPMSLSQICFSESTMASNSSNSSAPGSPGDSSTGQLTMEENGQVRYLGKSSGYYLVQKSRAYQNGAFHFSGWGHKFSTCERPPVRKSLDPYELPPKDLSRHLLNQYFEYFYPSLPLFYKKRLTSSLNSPLEPISPLLLNAIYAVASRISPDVRTRSDPDAPDTAGEIFFERARSLLDDYYDVPRISTVQALLLLAIHQHGTMKYARGWLYSGMAFRMALDLGLHRNCDHWNVPPDERERRKRVFWCCFIMDRLTSAIYGRSASFEERDCDVPFPSEDDDDDDGDNDDDGTEKRPKVLETFVQFIKICDILGHVLRNVYYAKARHQESAQHLEHVLTKLNRELTHWYNGLPPSLQYRLPDTEYGETGRAPPLAVAQIYMVYYTTVILLHRPFIPGPGHAAASGSSPASLPSYKICISAANSILDIVNVMLAEQQLRHVFNFAVYCVFTAGIVFIKMASSDDAAKAFDAKVYINKIMRALDEIEVTWMNAARCCNILGELAGLREINLECDEYVPRRGSKSDHQEQPAIAVPNSPEHEDDPQDFQERGAPSMDPFAAPNMVRNLHQQPYDPFHTAFWGVPPSLDVHEWNNYLNNTTTTTTTTTTTQTDDDQDNASRPAISSTHPLIPSHEFSPMHPLRTPLINQFHFQHQRASRDNPLSSMSLDMPSEDSVLLGLLTRSDNGHTQQEQEEN
ncbi:hypothetical protein LRAMOSA09387 [Lichtheimia ramosa]|uniref:Zn(2)-C6 fungal-type domain-containing protein n=1 Tax=Lichtheimia ramosa TaxID=688394 RepID=A0A077WJU6_9FUNG|nr:hypothetical protein LRAMOSA09387 [Lichtheimia ramosa]